VYGKNLTSKKSTVVAKYQKGGQRYSQVCLFARKKIVKNRD
jgi:hypothetical protein